MITKSCAEGYHDCEDCNCQCHQFMKDAKKFDAYFKRIKLCEVEMTYYLSFADDDKFLGSCFLKATGHGDALTKAYELKLNPGNCEVMIALCPEGEVVIPSDDKFNVLLTKEQLLEIWPDARSHGEFENDPEVGPLKEELVKYMDGRYL